MNSAGGIAIRDAVVLVTGAGGGIGRALVAVLLERGAAEVVACDRQAPGFDDPRVTPLALDITDEAAVAEAARRHAGRVTILINNAGVNANPRLFSDRLLAEAHSEIAVNYLGTLAMMQHFAPAMVARGGGQIANVVSFVGLVCGPGMAGYSASKAAAHMATVAARAELAPLGVGVLGIYPQLVDTGMSRHLALPKLTTEALAAMIVEAVEAGQDDLFPGPATEAFATLRQDPEGFQAMLIDRLGPARPQFK
ncbi:SDR family NAD(P)-dependent oxidoreductase [Leisingera thetidis]|uniref:SDR family NAD(P)-dependent oxidoreductase n=1 Tax=Leisingera thetidis TaxID=2930199 RepID=UPI0021F7FFD6|nr:SDR family NAD(P)-dependent oxidoreductase [Leisingera thetidis]